mmetsp:Transcript_37141/g.37595  ORF Transcript_37141/g.37595 Transcript_37141/m.37595 type:complete len:781 (-) Transcript_37141:1380-3722(-)
MVSLDNNDQQNAARSSPDLQLYFRDVRQGKKRPITIRSWSSILDVKKIIQKKIHVPIQSQHLYFGPLLTSGKALPNHRSLHDAGIYRSGETILLDVKVGSSLFSSSSSISAFSPRYRASSDIDISSSVIDSTPRPLRSLVQEARRALALNLKPEFILDGSGGTYFLHNTRKAKISVFKPADEEPYAENNPRGYIRQPGQDMFLREGVIPGEACIREVAAFMLDHGGFSGVPMTTLVECRHPSFNVNGSRLSLAAGGASIGAHSLCLSTSQTGSSTFSSLSKKVGSFQEFVRTDCSMDDLSPSKISVEEVHKIAILDIRLMNADRNSANLLCRRRRTDNSIELVPIDHGFCLRSVADTSWMDWCWLDWPHLKEPMSPKAQEYIINMNIEKDTKMLRERLNICGEALNYFYASSSILKAGTKAGLSLYEISVMCCRNDNLGEVPSKLEALFGMANDLAESAIRNDRWDHAVASRAIQEQLSPNGGSLLTPNLKNSFTRKAASAFDLTGLARSKDFNGVTTIPGMTQSAGSDSSSCSDDVDNEDCEEWAAEVITAVTLDTSTRLLVKSRSPSIESDTSSEDGGFWHKSPHSQEDSWNGSVDEEMNSDEESINWSPTASPSNDILGVSFMNTMNGSCINNNPLDMSYNPGDHARRTSFLQQQDTTTNCLQIKLPPRTPSRVSFVDVNNSKIDIDNECKNHECAQESNFNDAAARYGSKPLLKIRRSRSYSALSSNTSGTSAKDEKKISKRISFTEDQYREYFLKFVDLLIVREVTAAAAADSNL